MKTKTHLLNYLPNGCGSTSVPQQCRRWSRGSGKNDVFLSRRRVRFFLLASLFYVPATITFMYAGTFFALLTPLPGSVYRSPEVFQKLWPEMRSDNSSLTQLATVWTNGRRVDRWRTCTQSSTENSGSAAPIGFLIVEANGGLNQQRSSICDAVALAGLLNAVLIIPQFQFHNIWMDPSEFKDIFDEDHFIQMLEGYVKVVRKLPGTLMEKFDYNISNIPNLRVKAKASASYYMRIVYPILHHYGAIRISPFAYRLAMEVPSDIQSLRCLANYKALQFSVPIETLARKLVERMIEKSSNTDGNYVGVHLRFEEDMVAFSCCIYDGGKNEKIEMDSARHRGWREKFSRRGRISSPSLNRMHGKCPLTPLEVGMMLRGMGFDNNTSLYLASGQIYQAERNLAPLFQLFPRLQTKESLASPKELSSFQGYSSRLAALDYSICLQSEVFVTTQGGNFPHFMMGHRRYLYSGHAKTIKPDKRKLTVLLQNTSISWKTFKEHMISILRKNDRKGAAARKRKQSVYAYPSPDCTCQQHPPSSAFRQKNAPLKLNNSLPHI